MSKNELPPESVTRCASSVMGLAFAQRATALPVLYVPMRQSPALTAQPGCARPVTARGDRRGMSESRWSSPSQSATLTYVLSATGRASACAAAATGAIWCPASRAWSCARSARAQARVARVMEQGGYVMMRELLPAALVAWHLVAEGRRAVRLG